MNSGHFSAESLASRPFLSRAACAHIYVHVRLMIVVRTLPAVWRQQLHGQSHVHQCNACGNAVRSRPAHKTLHPGTVLLPLQTGKRRPMGKPHRRPASGVSLSDCCFFFLPPSLPFQPPSSPTRAAETQLTKEFRTSQLLASEVLVSGNSFTSPEMSRVGLVLQAVFVRLRLLFSKFKYCTFIPCLVWYSSLWPEVGKLRPGGYVWPIEFFLNSAG